MEETINIQTVVKYHSSRYINREIYCAFRSSSLPIYKLKRYFSPICNFFLPFPFPLFHFSPAAIPPPLPITNVLCIIYTPCILTKQKDRQTNRKYVYNKQKQISEDNTENGLNIRPKTWTVDFVSFQSFYKLKWNQNHWISLPNPILLLYVKNHIFLLYWIFNHALMSHYLLCNYWSICTYWLQDCSHIFSTI